MNRKSIAALVILAAAAAAAFFGRPSPAPDVTLATLDGRSLTLSALGGRVVLVNFWATSCASCLREFPKLAETHRKFSERGYETVAVAMSYDPPEAVREYVRQADLPFAFALDRDGKAAEAFGGVQVTPMTFVIDRGGRIAWKQLGEPDFPWLERLIERLLAEAV